jgi:hypothetical protein
VHLIHILGAPVRPENHNFMISGINLGHLGADLSILRCKKTLQGVVYPYKKNYNFCLPLKKKLGRSAKSRGRQMAPVEPWQYRSIYLHMCSPVQLDQFIKSRVVCGSPATHPPLGSVEMSREISPIPGFQPQ